MVLMGKPNSEGMSPGPRSWDSARLRASGPEVPSPRRELPTLTVGLTRALLGAEVQFSGSSCPPPNRVSGGNLVRSAAGWCPSPAPTRLTQRSALGGAGGRGGPEAASGAPLAGLLASRHSRRAPVGVASPGPARAQVRVPDSCRRIRGPAVSRRAAPSWEGFAAPQPQRRRPLRAWPRGIYDSRQRPRARLVLTLGQLAPLCRCQEPPGHFLLAFEKDLPVATGTGVCPGRGCPVPGGSGWNALEGQAAGPGPCPSRTLVAPAVSWEGRGAPGGGFPPRQSRFIPHTLSWSQVPPAAREPVCLLSSWLALELFLCLCVS